MKKKENDLPLFMIQLDTEAFRKEQEEARKRDHRQRKLYNQYVRKNVLRKDYINKKR